MGPLGETVTVLWRVLPLSAAVTTAVPGAAASTGISTPSARATAMHSAASPTARSRTAGSAMTSMRRPVSAVIGDAVTFEAVTVNVADALVQNLKLEIGRIELAPRAGWRPSRRFRWGRARPAATACR